MIDLDAFGIIQGLELMEEFGRDTRGLPGPEDGDVRKPVSPNRNLQFARQHMKEIVLPIMLVLRAVAEFVYG